MTDRDKAVELLARALHEVGTSMSWYHMKDDATALLAQLAPLLTVQAVRVMPLVWFHDSIPHHPIWTAEGHVIEDSGDEYTHRYELILPTGNSVGVYTTLELAKAAAQADDEARILSAIEAVPPAQAVEAERAACTEEMRLAVAAAREQERERCAKVAVDAVARFPVVIHRKEILRGRTSSGEYLDTAQGYVTKEDCLAFWANAVALINAPEVTG